MGELKLERWTTPLGRRRQNTGTIAWPGMGLSAVAGAVVAAIAPAAWGAPFTYTPAEATNTAGMPDNWSAGAGAGWSGTPSSATDTTLIFNVPTTTTVSRFTANDVANPFQLNVLTFQGTGPAGNSATSTLTLQGSGLDLRTDGTTTPVVNLNASRGATGTPTPTMTVNVGNAITLTNDTTFQGNGNATAFNFNGVISGGGNLTKSGSSTMRLGATGNNYTGSTNVSAGILQLAAGNVIPNASPVNVSGTGQFSFNNQAETIASLMLTGTANINNVGNTTGVVISGAMTNSSTSTGGSGAAFVVNSSGLMTINGVATFNAGSQSLIGGGSGTRITFNGGINFTGATFRINTGSNSRITLNSDVTSNASANTSGFTNNGTGTLANPFDLNGGNRMFTIADGAAAVDFTIAAAVTSITGTGAITKAGPGLMALTNSGNNYTGGTFITAGSVAPDANGALGTGGVTVSIGAVLDLSSVNVTTGAIADTATLTLSSSGPTFATVSFGASTLNEAVAQLIVNGTPQAPGTYTSGNLPNFITGSGSVTVVPEPAITGLLAASAAGLLLRRRRTLALR